MEFDKLSDAQRELFKVWAARPRSTSRTVVTEAAVKRGEKRRRIESRAISKEVGKQIREVWE